MGHKLQTPRTILMEERYSDLGLKDGWTWDQVSKLAKLMSMTEYELCFMAGCTYDQFRHFRKAGKVSRTVAIHFAVWKGWYMKAYLGTDSMPVVPIDIVVD